MEPGVLRRHPVGCAAAGTSLLGFSAVFFKLSSASATTGAFWRFALAAPILLLLARRRGTEPGQGRRSHVPIAIGAGAIAAVDVVLWQQATLDVGAGLGTVLGNAQLAVLVVLDWTLLGRRPSREAQLGILLVLAGLVLVSGVLTSSSYGTAPVQGTVLGAVGGALGGVYIVTLRRADRTSPGPISSMFWSSSGSALTVMAWSACLDRRGVGVGLAEFGWLALLAVTCQVIGWLLVAIPIRILPASTTGIVFILQPLVALVASFAIFDERPSAAQFAGVAVALLGVVITTRGPASRRPRPARLAAVRPWRAWPAGWRAGGRRRR
jgi:drug/metabolite transporter (DMT)-like permease